MPEVKWVYPRELYDADSGHDTMLPVLTLDQLEAWLREQSHARAGNGLHICVDDLLAQVQAWKEKP